MDLGELRGVLRAAGARRNQPASVVAAARERGSWGREDSRETERFVGRERGRGWVGYFFSFFFFSFSLDGWMDGRGVDS